MCPTTRVQHRVHGPSQAVNMLLPCFLHDFLERIFPTGTSINFAFLDFLSHLGTQFKNIIECSFVLYKLLAKITKGWCKNTKHKGITRPDGRQRSQQFTCQLRIHHMVTWPAAANGRNESEPKIHLKNDPSRPNNCVLYFYRPRTARRLSSSVIELITQYQTQGQFETVMMLFCPIFLRGLFHKDTVFDWGLLNSMTHQLAGIGD